MRTALLLLATSIVGVELATLFGGERVAIAAALTWCVLALTHRHLFADVIEAKSRLIPVLTKRVLWPDGPATKRHARG